MKNTIDDGAVVLGAGAFETARTLSQKFKGSVSGKAKLGGVELPTPCW